MSKPDVCTGAAGLSKRHRGRWKEGQTTPCLCAGEKGFSGRGFQEELRSKGLLEELKGRSLFSVSNICMKKKG